MTTYQKQKNINMNDTTKILVRGGAILFGGLILVFVTKKLIVKGKKKRNRRLNQYASIYCISGQVVDTNVRYQTDNAFRYEIHSWCG